VNDESGTDLILLDFEQQQARSKHNSVSQREHRRNIGNPSVDVARAAMTDCIACSYI
jgi:hypothetical protein